ncbi:MAG: Histidine triad nucleotide-binding protein 2, mitochondrial [Marteilia pararefringens]
MKFRRLLLPSSILISLASSSKCQQLSPGVHNSHFSTIRNMTDSKSPSSTSASSAAAATPNVTLSVFEKIARKLIPATILYEDEKVCIVEDLNKIAKVHCLAFLKHNYIAQFSDIQEDHLQLVGHLMLKSSQFAKEQCPNGFRIVINNGDDGCQSIYHMHVHIIGGEKLGWSKDYVK